MTEKDLEIVSLVDHTLLAQTATWEEIRALCDDALEYGTASVCIPPSFVKRAKEYLCGRMAVCTVIGFPNGYSTTAVKVFETKDALLNGADEVDMVVNLGWVKEGRFDLVKEEIRAIKEAAGDKVLKVIIETCLLSGEEKIRMCEVVTAAGADFIKTSTGFAGAGATFSDITLFKEHVGKQVKIKAAGGIADLLDAKRFVELGAHRLGTSRVIRQLKDQEQV
ncbi:MAG: deoxyribose-phosphate aldolase [Lachnospiraceae bacterium]|nr:deoxyribose-phosphate aldolase [Lachnospiraceae bacterium]